MSRRGELDIKKGDLLWASEFADAKAMQAHQDEPHHLAVGKKGADAGCVMENVWTGGWRVTNHGCAQAPCLCLCSLLLAVRSATPSLSLSLCRCLSSLAPLRSGPLSSPMIMSLRLSTP